MKGIFDNYSKFLVQKLFKSILRYKFTVKGKKKITTKLPVVDEDDSSDLIDNDDENDESSYPGS